MSFLKTICRHEPAASRRCLFQSRPPPSSLMRTRLDVFGRCPGESARSRMQDVCPAFAVNRCRRGPMNNIVAFGGDQIILSLRKLMSARGCVMIHNCILKKKLTCIRSSPYGRPSKAARSSWWTRSLGLPTAAITAGSAAPRNECRSWIPLRTYLVLITYLQRPVAATAVSKHQMKLINFTTDVNGARGTCLCR